MSRTFKLPGRVWNSWKFLRIDTSGQLEWSVWFQETYTTSSTVTAWEDVSAWDAISLSVWLTNENLVTQILDNTNYWFLWTSSWWKERVWQTFLTDSDSFNLYQISLKWYRVSDPECTLIIRETDENWSILYTETKVASLFWIPTSSAAEFDMLLSSPILVDPSTTYFIEFQCPWDWNASSWVIIRYQNTDVYASWNMKTYDASTWTNQSTWDLYFKVENSVSDWLFKAYKWDASDTSKINFIWFSDTTTTSWNTLTLNTAGVDNNQSSLSVGSEYYLANTTWAISTTPWINSVLVWKSLSATELIINPGGM